MDNQESVYVKLIEKYKDKQLIVAIEELSELQKELCKALRGKPNKEDIIEELADVLIMLDQVKIYFKIEDELVNFKNIDEIINNLLNTENKSRVYVDVHIPLINLRKWR